MIRACISCELFGLQRCQPETASPLDPAYASDCPSYRPIPASVLPLLKETAPRIYAHITQGGQTEVTCQPTEE